MKAILEFNLPEEAQDFKNAQENGFWKSVVFEFDQKLRSMLKYEDNLDDAVNETLQVARNELHTLINEKGLEL